MTMSCVLSRGLPAALHGITALRGITALGMVFVATACGPADLKVVSAPGSAAAPERGEGRLLRPLRPSSRPSVPVSIRPPTGGLARASVSSAPTSRTEGALAQKDACPLDAADVSPHPAPSRQVALPDVPQMEPLVLLYEDDDAFTVGGAAYQLRSEAHRASVTQREITIRGIIAKTTLPDAPKCSVHATGIADPYDCRSEVPAFWLCDRQHDSLDKCIKVMGWASNNAQIYDALKEYDNDVSANVIDNFWGVALPKPLPAVGANVRVVGTYATTFTRSTTGTEENDFMGILTANEVITHIEGPELATLPGVKRKPGP